MADPDPPPSPDAEPSKGEADLARGWAERMWREPLGADEEVAGLCDLIKADLRRRFERGEAPAVAGYLGAFPQLDKADSRMISLIYEEYCLREEHGDAIDAESFCARYPNWKDSLASQLKYHRLLSKAPGLSQPTPDFPDPGDDFEEFALGPRIGVGGYSHVFVANDLSLGGKRVVLKVSVDRGQEAETQGALDHPHIVPVNSVVYQPDNGLRGLSMPFRLGSPLDEVIRRVREAAGVEPPRSARVLWDALVGGIDRKLLDALDDDFDAVIAGGPEGDGWRGFPVDGSFARGVAWVGQVLANALDYAHRRDTFHRDVKPGNVLLTLQHGPQLLDFNLAHSPHSPHEAAATFGGTLPYMAPEQIEAFLVPERWSEVGALADVYSLGLVLRELLTGQTPDLPDPATTPQLAMRDLLHRRATMSIAVRSHNPRVPHALEAIVKKCLCLDPKERYASGKLLADDLENFLHRRPLDHALNPSRAERFTDWTIRNRRVVAANVFYLCVLGLLSPLIVRQVARWFQPELRQRPAFQQAVGAVDRQDYNRAVELLTTIVEDDPKAPLPRFYLGIALARANQLPEDPAFVSYGKAVASADADFELQSWAKEHPSVVEQLRWFGANGLDKLLAIRAVPRSSGGQPGSSDDASLKKATQHIDGLADHALRAALKADPTSKEAKILRASLAEYRGDLETAHARLTALLSLGKESVGDVTASELCAWRLQRARVAMLRAQELIDESQADCDPRRALEFVDQAVADLDLCARAVIGHQMTLYYGVRTEALLTRGEIHCDLGQARLALTDSKEAKRDLEIWLDIAKATPNPVPVDVDRMYHARLRKLRERASTANPTDDGPSQQPELTNSTE